MQKDSLGIHEEIQGIGKNEGQSDKGKEPMEHVLAASPRQGAMLSSPKVAKPQTAKKRVPRVVTQNVTRALQSKGKLPKKPIVEFPKRKSTRRATQSKGKDKEESSHEQEREFDIIQIQSDVSENEARILENLLIHREGQIDALRADLRRSRNFNQFLQVQNKKMSVQMVVYET